MLVIGSVVIWGGDGYTHDAGGGSKQGGVRRAVCLSGDSSECPQTPVKYQWRALPVKHYLLVTAVDQLMWHAA